MKTVMAMRKAPMLAAVIASASEAIQKCLPRKQFGLLRGACHRARIRATRWLLATKPIAPLRISACPASMLRLSSKHESWSRYRHGRLAGRRPRPRQHADRAAERSRADRERARAGGRHHAANRELASR